MVREKMLFFVVLSALLIATVSVSFAQHFDPMRRIGVFMYLKQNDPESQTYLAAFREGLQKAGWVVGRNLEIEYR
jgi:putative tryptophan/tyrosine transport system substrate-binding protein